MSRLGCRGSIIPAAVMVALLSSGPADAQVGNSGSARDPGGPGNGLVTGVYYDVANQAKAERRLRFTQAKLGRDRERSDEAAVGRDVRRIDRLEYRIAVDEWLIRMNSLQDPGLYPFGSPGLSPGDLGQIFLPPQAPRPPVPQSSPGPPAAAPTITITVVNAGPAGSGVAFSVDGDAHQAEGGSRQDLAVAPGSVITYDAGGSLGRRRFSLSPGTFEFRSTAEGWELYQLPATP